VYFGSGGKGGSAETEMVSQITLQ